MSIELDPNAVSVAAHLAKLEGTPRAQGYIEQISEAATFEELKEVLAHLVAEHHQHELDMAALRLAGPNANRDQRLEAAEAIKVAIMGMNE